MYINANLEMEKTIFVVFRMQIQFSEIFVGQGDAPMKG